MMDHSVRHIFIQASGRQFLHQDFAAFEAFVGAGHLRCRQAVHVEKPAAGLHLSRYPSLGGGNVLVEGADRMLLQFGGNGACR